MNKDDRHIEIDRNFGSGIAFFDSRSDYWKQSRNIDQSDCRQFNEALHKGKGRIVTVEKACIIKDLTEGKEDHNVDGRS